MQETRSITEIENLVKDYQRNRLSGWDLVRSIDDLVAKNYAHEFTEAINNLISEFQNELALYVHDEETRKEAPEVYYCDDELRIKVEEFRSNLANLLSG